MKPVKVMIVDDEVLAIEHIVQLVPWQRLGYEIVCTTSNPAQALRLAQQHRPELAIVDIVMPGMDGLELSRQLSALGFIEKIVLLTSYKEFDYAKEAVKLGLSNYWVKHEMDAKTLKTELGGLRQEIEQARRRRETDRSRLLLDWLGGRPITDEQWSTIAFNAATDRLHLAVLQPDKPFPLLAGIAPNVASADTSTGPEQWPDDGDQERLAAVRLPDGPFILVYPSDGSKGESVMRAYVEQKAAAARHTLERAVRGTVSMALAYGLRGREELPGKAAEALHMLARGIFFGPRHTFRLNESQPSAATALVWQDATDRIRDALSAMQIEEALRELPPLFKQAAVTQDLGGFSDMCRQLAAALNRCRTAAGLPSLAEWANTDELAATDWTSLEGIQRWFEEQLRMAAAAWHGQSALSRKVRLAIDYMEKSYGDPDIDTDAIAREVGLSRDHLRHVFREETGQTVLDRLTDIRMRQAGRLLDEGRFKVYEIAEKVGFRNSRYFSQVFRKTTGMTPLDYMERPR